MPGKTLFKYQRAEQTDKTSDSVLTDKTFGVFFPETVATVRIRLPEILLIQYVLLFMSCITHFSAALLREVKLFKMPDGSGCRCQYAVRTET